MYVVCVEHIEDGIDEFVVKYEQAPDVVKLEKIDLKEVKNTDKCEFCDEKPRFLVRHGGEI